MDNAQPAVAGSAASPCWMATRFNTMHLFAGAGGGILADLILGHTPIVAVEWDPYACAVLRERAADGWFPGLRVHEGDVRMFDPSEYTGRVDCIHAGFPCQDISVAGNGAGINGERSGLYREILRIADVVRPRFLFLENSPAITVNGLGTVLGDLAARGYDGRWTVLAASDVGAPHIRERWWGLFWRDADGGQSRCGTAHTDQARVLHGHRSPGGQVEEARPGVGHAGVLGHAADATGQRRGERRTESATGREAAAGEHCSPLGDTDRVRELQSQGGESDQRGWTGNAGWWGAEPDVGRVAYGVAARTHQIAALGNGQVPLCAAAAWRILAGPMNHEAPSNSLFGRTPPQDGVDGKPPNAGGVP